MVEQKIQLLRVSVKDNKIVFKLEKHKDFFALLQLFLKELDFKETDDYHLYDEMNVKVEDYVDIVKNYSNEDYDIDVIYTGEKIVIIVRTEKSSLDVRKAMLKIAKYGDEDDSKDK